MSSYDMSLYDMSLARELASSLTGAHPEPSEGGAVHYACLKRPGTRCRSAETEKASSSLVFDTWDAFLIWCLDISDAETGFIVNPQGFVIASWGKPPEKGYDGLGAEVAFALDQNARIDPNRGRLKAMYLDFGDVWITGIRLELADSSFVLGLLGSAPLVTATRRLVEQTAENSAQYLG